MADATAACSYRINPRAARSIISLDFTLQLFFYQKSKYRVTKSKSNMMMMVFCSSSLF